MNEVINKISLRIEIDKEIKIGEKITSPKSAANVFQEQIGNYDREVVAMLCFNTNNEPISFHIASIGSINSSIVSVREIFKTALITNSAKIILAHNHPSGNLLPSEEDINTAANLKAIGRFLNVPVLDHIIVTPNKGEYFSLEEHKMIPEIEIGDTIKL